MFTKFFPYLFFNKKYPIRAKDRSGNPLRFAKIEADSLTRVFEGRAHTKNIFTLHVT